MYYEEVAPVEPQAPLFQPPIPVWRVALAQSIRPRGEQAGSRRPRGTWVTSDPFDLHADQVAARTPPATPRATVPALPGRGPPMSTLPDL